MTTSKLVRRLPAGTSAATPLLQISLALIIGGAIVIAALAYQTWIDFGVTQLRGTDTDGVFSAGDGYFVIGLAAVIMLFAVAAYLRPQYWAGLLPCIGLASVAIGAIAAYDLGTSWHVSGTDIHGAFVDSGSAAAELYGTLVIAVAIAVVAAIAAGLKYRERSLEEPTTEL